VPARALVFERLVLDGRVEAEERLEVLGLAEELGRVEAEERLEVLGLAEELGRVEAEERLEVLGLAEELERVEVEERLDWDDRLVEPDRAWLDRLTLLFLLGLRLPER